MCPDVDSSEHEARRSSTNSKGGSIAVPNHGHALSVEQFTPTANSRPGRQVVDDGGAVQERKCSCTYHAGRVLGPLREIGPIEEHGQPVSQLIQKTLHAR